MNILKTAVLGLFTVAIISCNNESDQENVGEINPSEELDELLSENEGWSVQSDYEFCEIDIPDLMKPMPELNPQATVKFGSTEKAGNEVLENYIIVIPETYKELEELGMELKFSLESYSSLSVASMGEGKQNYKVLTKEKIVEKINGIDAIINEMQGSLILEDGKKVDIYYMMGIYKGVKGYYKVLSWTLLSQKDNFRKNMNRMMHSFKEI